jgi:hypothetical protein
MEQGDFPEILQRQAHSVSNFGKPPVRCQSFHFTPTSFTFNLLRIHSKSFKLQVMMTSHFDNQKSHPSLANLPRELRQKILYASFLEAMDMDVA